MFCYCWLWLCELCLVFWQINPVFKLRSCCGDAYRKLEDLESDALWPSITLLHTHLNYFPFICLHFSSFSFFFSSPLHIHIQHINTQTWALLNCLNSMTVCMDSGAIIESALSHASDDLRLDFTKWKKTQNIGILTPMAYDNTWTLAFWLGMTCYPPQVMKKSGILWITEAAMLQSRRLRCVFHCRTAQTDIRWYLRLYIWI